MTEDPTPGAGQGRTPIKGQPARPRARHRLNHRLLTTQIKSWAQTQSKAATSSDTSTSAS